MSDHQVPFPGCKCQWCELVRKEMVKDAAQDLLAALQPFAEWARGLAEVEQPDAFEYRRLKRPDTGGTTLCEVTAEDFARVLSAIAKAESRS